MNKHRCESSYLIVLDMWHPMVVKTSKRILLFITALLFIMTPWTDIKIFINPTLQSMHISKTTLQTHCIYPISFILAITSCLLMVMLLFFCRMLECHWSTGYRVWCKGICPLQHILWFWPWLSWCWSCSYVIFLIP